MKNKNNPQTPKWKLWIVIITMVQALTAIQSYRIGQEQWQVLEQQARCINQHLEASNRRLAAWNQLLESLLDTESKKRD